MPFSSVSIVGFEQVNVSWDSKSDDPRKHTGWSASKFGVFSGPHFALFSTNVEKKNGPKKLLIQTPCTYFLYKWKESFTILKPRLTVNNVNSILYRTFEVIHDSHSIPAGNYMLKVSNRNTRTRCEICSVNNKNTRMMSVDLFHSKTLKIKLKIKLKFNNYNNWTRTIPLKAVKLCFNLFDMVFIWGLFKVFQPQKNFM